MVVEDWEGHGVSGRNVDAYNAEDKHWHRLFVNTFGKVHVFEGTSDGTSIRYEGISTESDGERTWNRLTIRKDSPSRITEEWKKSTNGGKTWQNAFKAIYVRA